MDQASTPYPMEAGWCHDVDPPAMLTSNSVPCPTYGTVSPCVSRIGLRATVFPSNGGGILELVQIDGLKAPETWWGGLVEAARY
jgi:hypothetical protein